MKVWLLREQADRRVERVGGFVLCCGAGTCGRLLLMTVNRLGEAVLFVCWSVFWSCLANQESKVRPSFRWAMVTQKPTARTLPSSSPPERRLPRLHALPVGPSYSRVTRDGRLLPCGGLLTCSVDDE